MGVIRFLNRRLGGRADAEHIQVGIRLLIVSAAMLYFHSGFFARNAQSNEYVELAGIAVNCAFVVTIGLALALLVRPGVSVARRLIGIVHDVSAISTAMLLGESAAAAVAAIYLWVTIGNGFRYGVNYLYACALLSFSGFAAVVYFSDYWREQATLSFNILVLIAVIPPYVGKLLTSLHTAKAQLKHQASSDALTGLMNRSELERCVRDELALKANGHVLLFCDLDYFKQVNDVAGHAAGDKVLSDVGAIIRNCVRAGDLVARIGGDEFCVFLKQCPLQAARQIAEDIRNSVSGYRLAWGTGYFTVGVSVGAAPSAAVRDMSSLFRLADAACYAAKNAGRNQVHLVNPDTDLTDTQVIRKLHAESAA